MDAGKNVKLDFGLMVTRVASEIFEREVCLSDNFFDLGGNSVCAIELVSRIEADGKVSLEADWLFEGDNLGSFVASIEEANLNGELSCGGEAQISRRGRKYCSRVSRWVIKC
jgi:acyl carrier protein